MDPKGYKKLIKHILVALTLFMVACSDDTPSEETDAIVNAKVAILNPSITEMNFPSTVIGDSSSLSVVISNVGESSASGIQLTIPSTPFQLTAGTCTNELYVGQSCELTITFTPTVANTYTENIYASYNDGVEDKNFSISLSGVSVIPETPSVTGLIDAPTPVQSSTWNWDCTTSCEYRHVINTSPTHSFTSESYTGTQTAAQSTGTEDYYIHVQARDLNYGTESEVTTVVATLDNTAPTAISDLSLDADATETKSATMHFTASSDETELSHYLLAIGTTSGGDNIVEWVEVALATEIQYSGGSFSNGTEYYTSIIAVDTAGNESPVVESLAWMPPGPPAAVANLSVSSALITQVSLGWAEPFHNGLVILDYFIYFKESLDTEWILYNDGVSTDTVATIDGLTAATDYDFKVIAFNGSSSTDSNIATAQTAPDNEFFEPTFKKAMNLGGATDSQVTVLDDATVEHIRGGAVLNSYSMLAGEVQPLTTELNDIIKSDKPMFVAGRKGAAGASDKDKGNMVWMTPDWAGKTFNFTGSRYAPHLVNVYAFEATDIEVFKGASSIDTISLEADEFHTFSINDYGGFTIQSSGLIIAHMHSSGSSSVADPRPLLPASNDILGFPSTTLRMTTINDANTYTGYHSNGNLESGTLTFGAEKSIGAKGTTSLYRSEALRIIANDKVVGNSHADSNGYCSAPFVPVGMLKKRFAVNVSTEYVAFASVEPGDIIITAPDGSQITVPLTRTDNSPYVPYKARVINQAAGTRFESTTRFQAWYQPDTNTNAANDDETIMFGFDE